MTCEIFPDTVGGVHLYCYSKNDNSKLSYAYWKDGELLIPEVPFMGGHRYRSSLLDSGNNLHSYWTATVPVPGGSVTGQHHHCLFPDLTWGEERVISDQEPAGTYRVSWDGEDRLVFGWKAYAQAISLVFLDGCVVGEIQSVELPTITYGWGGLTSVNLNTSINRVCTVVKRNYVQEYGVRCAEYRR